MEQKPFSNSIVRVVILSGMTYAIVVLTIFFITGNEPKTLTPDFYRFIGVELLAVAGIKVTKVVKEKLDAMEVAGEEREENPEEAAEEDLDWRERI